MPRVAGQRAPRRGIGNKLGIGLPTVATHLSGARKKLGAATREQALVLALRHGLINP